MKSMLVCTLIGSAFVLLGLASCPVLAQDQSSNASPELTNAAKAMLLAMDQKEIDKAFAVMTDKGADQYMGLMLMQVSQIGQMHGPGDPSDDLKQLQKLIEQYGLDKVAIDIPMPDGSGNDEKQVGDMLRAIDEAEKKYLACIPAGERRKATQEMLQAMGKILASPTSLHLGEFAINGEQAEVPLLTKLPPEVAQQEGIEDRPAQFLLFAKRDGQWKFDGFNNKRLIEEMLTQFPEKAQPFKEIVGLTIEGETIDEQPVNLASYKGKVVLVDFWGTWCGPCVAGLPKLVDLQEKYNAKGFDILGVAADDVDSLKAFLEKKSLPWKNVTDAESELANKYSIMAYPTTLLVDKQGKHVATNLHGETLEKAIALLLDGKSIESINGNAEKILEIGKKRAAEEKKLIFLHFSATWCGPCRQLEKWMAQPEVHELLEKVFVDVKIDVDSNLGAQELINSFSPNAQGIPWYAILNGTDSKPIATCEDEKTGNIGFPDSQEGFDHFVKMFEATGKFSKEQLDLLRSSLSKSTDNAKSKSSK